MSNGSGDKAANGTLSPDVKWMVGVVVAAIIAIGTAAVAVSMTVFQFSRTAVDMRNHEHRTNASNSDVILALEGLIDGLRDDYRNRMRGVEDVLHELRAVRQLLNDADDHNVHAKRDLERALSNVEQALTALILFRPVRTSDVTARLEEIRGELQAIRRDLEGGPEPELEGGPESEPEGGPDPEPEGLF